MGNARRSFDSCIFMMRADAREDFSRVYPGLARFRLPWSGMNGGIKAEGKRDWPGKQARRSREVFCGLVRLGASSLFNAFNVLTFLTSAQVNAGHDNFD